MGSWADLYRYGVLTGLIRPVLVTQKPTEIWNAARRAGRIAVPKTSLLFSGSYQSCHFPAPEKATEPTEAVPDALGRKPHPTLVCSELHDPGVASFRGRPHR